MKNAHVFSRSRAACSASRREVFSKPTGRTSPTPR